MAMFLEQILKQALWPLRSARQRIKRTTITKDPCVVVHDVESLENYMHEHLDRMGMTFEQWMTKFGRGMYLSRNMIMLDLLMPLQPRRVLEFACAGGYLASLLLDRLPYIQKYVCSNFSSQMLDYTKSQLAGYGNCEVALLDADVGRSSDMSADRISAFDTFVTTSFEHIQFDRELIQHMPAGSNFVFSVALFDDPEHFRVFNNKHQIRRRYNDLLDIAEIQLNAEANKAIVSAKVRSVPTRNRLFGITHLPLLYNSAFGWPRSCSELEGQEG
jgi:protein-L-isoaspartate O-methyltransferase